MLLVVGMKMDPSSSVLLTDDSPKSMKFGLLERTVSLTKFIRPRAYTSALLLVNVLLRITLLLLGVGSLFLAGFI